MCGNNRFCMRKWFRNVAGIILHQLSAPGVAEMTYFDVFWYFKYVLHVFLCIFIEDDLFCSFWGSGDVKNNSSMYVSSYLIWLNSDFNHFWSYILYFIPEKEPGPTWEEPLCTRTPGTHGPNLFSQSWILVSDEFKVGQSRPRNA